MPRGKPDAAVERLVREADKHFDYEHPADRITLRRLLRKAYLSAARECAEIADRAVVSSGVTLGGKAIRTHFGLEAK